jgi:hypothetical protein
MTFTHRLLLVPLVASLAAPALAQASTEKFQCGMTHFIRSGGTEMVSSSISVRNADPMYPATIVQLTIRNGEGTVVHESGPAAGTPLPLNTDFPISFPGGKDITVVPPGGVVYLRSNHVWGNNGLPTGAAGNEAGQSLSATVAVAKDGRRSNLFVTVSPRIRTRAAGSTPGSFVETDTRAIGHTVCEPTP